MRPGAFKGVNMGNVGRKKGHRALWIVIAALLLTGILVLSVHPSAVTTNTYIDANSGDVRVETTVFGLPVKDTIKKTQFSREVRRLNRAVLQNRAWQPVLIEEGLLMGTHIDGRLGGVPDLLDWIVGLLERARVPDQERLVVMERILGTLRNEKSDRGDITDELSVLSSRLNKEK